MKRWSEIYLNIVDVMAVPSGAKKFVTESKDEYVLDHLFTKVMVDTENLLFSPVWLQSPL